MWIPGKKDYLKIQQKEFAKKCEKFAEEYKELCRRHRIELIPAIQYLETGIILGIKFREFPKEKEEEKADNKK